MSNLKKFLEFEIGAIPLIISVPHGGTLEYRNIPIRSKGVLGIDKATIELAKEFIFYLKHKSRKITSDQHSPSYILSKIRRSKIDLNRIESEAYDSNSALARKIFQVYHKKIKEIITQNLSKFSYSLLIDIHGFEKHKRPPGFRDVELILGTDNLVSLFSESVPKKDWDKNIRGKIIKKFLKLGIPIAPGHPRRREYVLTGGYIIKQYGAAQIPRSQAIQIEFSDRIRFHDKELRDKVLKALTEVILPNVLEKNNNIM
ncbi:MAG: hypothetical protein ACFE8A_12130 [Candidatus Hodarchaeota archaeon]